MQIANKHMKNNGPYTKENIKPIYISLGNR